MKLTSHKLQFTVLILLFLPLFGWGCAKESVVSNQPEVGQDTVASVDTSPSPDTIKPIDTSAPDIVKPTDTTKLKDTTKPKDITPDTTTKDTVKDVNQVPEGWKVWNVTNELVVGYPKGWFTQKDTRYAGVVHVNLHPTELPPIETKTDVVPAIMLTVENTLAPLNKSQWDFEKEDNVSLGGQQIFRGEYHSELLDNELVAVYWWQSDSKTYTVTGMADDQITEQFVVTTIQLTEKE